MRTATASVALVVLLALLFLSAVDALAQNRTLAAPPPANYRQLIAAYMSADNRYTVRDAKITPPYDRWGGLLKGGTVTVVCVAVFRDNPLGIVVRDNWVFGFEGGQIKPTTLGMDRCSDLAPFPELMKTIAARRTNGGTR